MNQKTKIEIYEKVLKKLADYYSTNETGGINELCKNCDRWVHGLKQEDSPENKRYLAWAYRTLDRTPETDTIIRRRERKKVVTQQFSPVFSLILISRVSVMKQKGNGRKKEIKDLLDKLTKEANNNKDKSKQIEALKKEIRDIANLDQKNFKIAQAKFSFILRERKNVDIPKIGFKIRSRMKEIIIDGAIVDWLEDVPLDELPNEYVRMVVQNFREGHMSVSEAIEVLNEECEDLLINYVKTNKELQSLLGEDYE